MNASKCNMASDEWKYNEIVSRVPNARIITVLRDPSQEIRSQLEHDIRHKGRYRTPHEKLEIMSSKGYNINNEQSRRLGLSDANYDSIATFLKERIYIIGITEYMWHTNCLISYKLKAFDASCDCRRMVKKQIKKNVHRDESVEYRSGDLIKMHELVSHDRLLYNAAWSKFVQDLRTVERERGVSLLDCLR